MESIQHDEALTKLLRTLTRECSFDFEAVAFRVREHYSKRGKEIESHEERYLTLTGSDCREYFAADYSSTTNEFVVKSTKAPESFDEVLELQQRIEAQSRLNHAAVFERVRQSLGITPHDDFSVDSDEVRAAVERRNAEMALREEQKRLKIAEQEAAAILKDQRLRLWNRFDPNSIDAEGINPIADTQANAALEAEPYIHETFSISDVLNSPEFDALLTDIEMSLDLNADDKYVENSELGEVLRYLEEAAKTSPARVPGTHVRSRNLNDGNINLKVASVVEPNISASPSASHSKSIDGVSFETNHFESATQLAVSTTRSSKRPGDKSADVASSSGEDNDSEDCDDDWAKRRNRAKVAVQSVIPVQHGKLSRFGSVWKGKERVSADVEIATFEETVYSANHQRKDDFEDDDESSVSIATAEKSDDADVGDLGDAEVADARLSHTVDVSPLGAVHESSESVNVNTDDSNNIHDVSIIDVNEIIVSLSVQSSGLEAVHRGGILGDANLTDHKGSSEAAVTQEYGRVGRHSRRENRFANSIAVAKSRSSYPLSTSDEGPTCSIDGIVDKTPLDHTKNEDPAVEESIIKQDIGSIGSEFLPESNVQSPILNDIPCMPPSLVNLIQSFMSDPTRSVSQSKYLEKLTIIQFSCSAALSRDIDAGLTMYIEWLFGFALHTKVRIACAALVDGSNGPADLFSTTPVVLKRSMSVLILKSDHVDDCTWEDRFLNAARNLTMKALASRLFPAVVCSTMFGVAETTTLDNFLSVCNGRESEAHFLHQVHHLLNFRPRIPSSLFSASSQLLSEHSMGILSDHLITCVLKSYVAVDNDGLFTLATFMRSCEEAGLRVISLRTAFISQNWIDAHSDVVRTIPSWLEQSVRSFSQSWRHDDLGFLCLNRDNALPLLTVTFYYSGGNCAQVLRDLLGPEDPSLARRTDPKSLRALIGHPTDRSRNICYPIAISSDHVFRDTLFWMCMDKNSKDSVINVDILDKSWYPRSRHVTVCVRVEFETQWIVENCKSGGRIAGAVQQDICAMLLAFSQLGLTVDKLCSVSDAYYNTLKNRINDDLDRNSESREIRGGDSKALGDQMNNSFCWIAIFQGTADDFAIKIARERLLSFCVDLSKYGPMVQGGGCLTCDVIPLEIASGKDFEGKEFQAKQRDRLVEVVNTILVDPTSVLSHENMFLADCVVIIFSLDNLLRFSKSIYVQDLASRIFKFLRSRYPSMSIVALHLLGEGQPGGSPCSMCLRGVHVIEDIESAVECVIDAFLRENCSFVQTKIHVGKDEYTKLSARQFVRISKGRQALQFLVDFFLVEELFSLLASVDSYLYTPQSCMAVECVPKEIQSPYKILKAFFPSGGFHASAVLLLPIGGSFERNLSRILKRFEKEGIDVLAMQHFEYDASNPSSLAWKECLLEGVKMEYEFEPEALLHLEAQFFSHQQPGCAIAIRGVGIFQRLVNILGPPRADEYSTYPRSIAASLSSTNAEFFCSLNCKTSEMMLKSIFGMSTEDSLLLLSITHRISELECHNEAFESTGAFLKAKKMFLQLSSREPNTPQSASSLTSNVVSNDRTVAKSLVASAISAEQKSSLLPVPIDVTCIIITSALLEEVGLSAIIDCFNRESIKIVNSRTMYLSADQAKKLFYICGHSSLSLHPALSVLLDGPSLCLALEGASHSLMKLKSMTIPEHSVLGGVNTPKCIWRLHGIGEWGIMMSSSVRLARELVLFCFSTLYGQFKIECVSSIEN